MFKKFPSREEVTFLQNDETYKYTKVCKIKFENCRKTES